MSTYYNENDPKAAAWLRELIKAGHIPAGDVDERSICDVRDADLNGYVQCHFFAGIGGWAYALRLAGWPDERPAWTGSCPCQPLSSAGLGRGHADERHLWPAFYARIAERRPATVFGEQVASKDGREWLAGVRADLEGVGYAFGASDLCAAGVGAPHRRQRLYWMAYAPQFGCGQGRPDRNRSSRRSGNASAERKQCSGQQRQQSEDCRTGWLGDPNQPRSQGRGLRLGGESDCRAPWASGFDLIPCIDGKARRVKSGLHPLAARVSGDVALLRGAGNAIVPQTAALFIEACRDIIDQ